MKKPPATDIAPTIGMASRTLIAAMMARLVSRGFDGLTPGFAAVMPLLDATGIRSSVLAQRAGVTKQATSQLIRLLEERGYVEKVPDPTDERAKVIRLTKRGLELRAACMEIRLELQQLAKETLGDARLVRLERDLAKLLAVFGQPPKT